MELNPDHPATREMHDLWHKMVALLMHKSNQPRVEITVADLESLATRFPGDMPTVLFYSKGDKITLRLMSATEGVKFANKEKLESN